MGTPPKRRLVVGPTIVILLALNLGWLARLEVQAQQTNKLTEHHLSLEGGADRLEALSGFTRNAGKNDITLSPEVLGVDVGPIQLHWYPHGITLKWEDDQGLRIDLNKTNAKIVMGSRFIEMSTDKEILAGIKDQHLLKISEEGLELTVNAGRANKAQLRLDANSGSFVVSSEGGQGYSLDLFQHGVGLVYGVPHSRGGITFSPSFSVADDSVPPHSLKIDSNADIRLEAIGNITLESTDGEIWIKGKKVHLNEEAGS